MKMPMPVTLALAVICLLLTPLPVMATGGPGACREDLQKFCMGTQPSRSRHECLQQHASELSPGCRERLSRARAKTATWSAACHDDIQKLCSKTDMIGGNVARCLRRHQGSLSQTCRDQLGQHHQRHQTSAVQ